MSPGQAPWGYSGDDGLATDAELSKPTGVAVTADGGFLIADTDNQVVRKSVISGRDHSCRRDRHLG